MKTSNILLLTALILILIGITTLIGFFKIKIGKDCIEGKGPVVEKEIKVEHFKGIFVNSHLTVELTQDTVQKVSIQAEENLIDNFTAVVIDEQLKISRIYCMKKSDNVVIKISVDSLEKLKVQSGGIVKSTNTIKGTSLDIEGNSGSNINLELVYSDVYCNLSAGAVCLLKGSAENLTSENNAGSVLEAENLTTGNCKVSANSGAVALVNTSGELTAEANSGAVIKYYGEPAKKSFDSNTGGNITPAHD